jgi:hypothetical protein
VKVDSLAGKQRPHVGVKIPKAALSQSSKRPRAFIAAGAPKHQSHRSDRQLEVKVKIKMKMKVKVKEKVLLMFYIFGEGLRSRDKAGNTAGCHRLLVARRTSVHHRRVWHAPTS